ncbi:MAG TPA: ABC transporter permease [Pyrinomonadaceae bacterium]|nr:ABC transporter permease [Pyrinomonadaceae bacterium]
MWDSFGQDVVYAVRMIWKKPGFSLIAAATLALGIGASTAIFSVVNGVLLRPLPYKDPNRIMTVWQNDHLRGLERQKISPPNFLDYKERNQVFETMAALRPYGFDYTSQGEPETIQSWLVTDGFFQITGTNALHGRTFLPEEFTAGKQKVVLLSYGLWQRRFGGNPNMVGQTMLLDGDPFTVVGILPPDFHFTDKREMMIPAVFSEGEKKRRSATYLYVFGRLKPGVTKEQADANLNAIAGELAQQYPQTNRQLEMATVALPDQLLGDVKPALFTLLGAVGLLLLISCVNVANLLLVRGAQRAREFAIRAALGATRRHLARQLLIEDILLALMGGIGGLLLGWAAHKFLILNPGNLPRIDQIRMDWRVLAFALGVSLITTLIFGLLPVVHFSKPDLQGALKEGGRSATSGASQNRVRRILVVSQLALALVLLIGAGLLARSFIRLLKIDPGFSADNVLTLQVHIYNLNPEPQQQVAYFDQVIQRWTSLPGVQSAGAVSAPPFVGEGAIEIDNPFVIEGREPPPAGQEPTAYHTVVTSDYFRTLNIPVLNGRTFTRMDSQQSLPVAVVNSTMARRFFENEDPVGKRLTLRWSNKPLTTEIVGVVGDVLHTGLDSNPRPEIFLHLPQAPFGSMTFVVRTQNDPLLLLPALKKELWAVNKDQPIYSLRTEEQLISASLGERRFSLYLIGIFGIVSLTLAAVGLYGLISISTSQRTQEFGVRIALGAQSSSILKMVIGEGLLLALIGVVVGVGGSLLLTRFLSKMLFGITPTDPFTFASISAVLVVVALLASYIPARRATRVDPLIALRQE